MFMAYFNELSDREHEVLELIVEGLSNTEIGQKLYLQSQHGQDLCEGDYE